MRPAPPALIAGLWGLLGFFLLIILWGAWVRITGSGAGCGQHWPTCHGEIIPTDPGLDTIIEFVHRVTSGLSVFLTIGLFVWVRRALPAAHPARWAMRWTLIFLIIECLIGAVLVLRALVGANDSVERAALMAIHLVNTSLLTGAALLTCWWSRRPAHLPFGSAHPLRSLWLGGIGVMLLLNVSGAVTALGDTLYPVVVNPDTGLLERLHVDIFSPTHFLIQLRVLHPVLAVAGSLYLVAMGAVFLVRARAEAGVVRWVWITLALVGAQVLCGFVNILLHAPGWMQILHLTLAKLLWLSLLWLGFWLLHHLTAAPAR